MIEPTNITWIITIFGTVIFLLLLIAQLVILIKPHSQQAKDILIAKGEDWRDKTHFKVAFAFAWADWLVIMPLMVAGNIGVLSGQLWGYLLWIILGTISIYYSIVFYVMEKEYVYPAVGPIIYYTYLWGGFLYWGIISIVYCVLRTHNVL
ncbi:MAG: hypothetical protein DRI75_13340 [Bacteroidetes bacterium]|nr:MAG: hypothetical protein DRI75_13340 [Bacteroidota bacterium]